VGCIARVDGANDAPDLPLRVLTVSPQEIPVAIRNVGLSQHIRVAQSANSASQSCPLTTVQTGAKRSA
jgi:hypothetical protein